MTTREQDMAELIKHFTTALAESKQTKVKEPNTYDGTRDALLIDGWIRSIERYATFHGWTPERTCLFATTLLRDRADAWFRTIENTDDAPTTWLEFKRLLIEFFRPDNSVRIARDKLAVLKQDGNVVDYINKFMDIKLAIPGMTDEEAHDKFIRGLVSKQMRAHIRQYESVTLKDAIHAALAFDSAQTEEDYVQITRATAERNQGYQGNVDPMEIDAIDQRRSRYVNTRNNNYRTYNNNECHYCHKIGHFKRNCRIRIADIKKMDQQHAKNNKRQDNQHYPVLQPSTRAEYFDVPKTTIIDELIPIIQLVSNLPDDLKYLQELNAIATTLPLYAGRYRNLPIKILIDCGASENYVSSRILQQDTYFNRQELIPVQDRQVETASGNVSEIKYKVNMDIELNGFGDKITAYVFETKFDLILGRSWLKQTQPQPDWQTDTWYLKEGSIKLTPITKYTRSNIPNLNYIITHRQASRYIKKGADSFLFYIKDNGTITRASSNDDRYWQGLIQEFAAVFRDELPGLPPDRGIHHVIDTGDAEPVSRAPYKMSPLELDELKKQLKQLLDLGLIRPSASPWGAPVLFVRKKPDPGSHKPGALRMCIDYRALNKVTIRNSASLPRIDECLERLRGAKYFTSLDLKSGYHQIRLAPEDIEKTAFNTRYGQFEWLVLPMGARNSPPAFVAQMNKILEPFIDKTVLVYLDDILIYSRSLEEHKQHVRQVLKTLQKEKMVVNLKKCAMGKTELDFVGFKISTNGIAPSPAKVQIIQNWPTPTNVQEVRQFTGFTQFYRRWIKNFAAIASPLTDLTRGTGLKKRPIIWNTACQESFDCLKKLIASEPILQVVNMDKPFKIEVDASDRGCGAVLLQPGDNDDLWHPVCFESKKFSAAEQKYPAQERELLGILHALRTWRCYIEGCIHGYKVYTDHLPLQYFRTKDKPPSRLVRWISELELYAPEIVYKKGQENIIPDILSRIEYDGNATKPGEESMEPEFLYAAWDFDEDTSSHVRTDWPLFLLPDIRAKVTSQKTKRILQREERFFEVTPNNRVFRKVKFNDQVKLVPFLPFAGRADTIAKYHESFGHMGFQSLLNIILPRYWWPNMKTDLQNWLQHCPSCQINSRRTRKHQDEMHPLTVPAAFDRWHLDFLDLPTTIKGNRWLLIGVDYTTNWPVARAVPIASTEAVADFIYEEIMMKFGAPSEIVTDRGSNFTSRLIETYLKKVGTHHKLTSAYHPRTNSKVERFNGVIKPMLRKYTNGAIHRWDDFVNATLWACRIRTHTTTGYSPFFLTYGRDPRLPGDTLQPYIDKATFKDPRTVADITARELASLGQHRAAAEAKLKAMAEKDKQKWDAQIKKVSFEVGDMVMLSHEGRYGLEPRFKGPFIVLQTFPEYGTYQLQTIAGQTLSSLVHVDRLKAAKGDKPTEPWYEPTAARRNWVSAMENINAAPNISNELPTVLPNIPQDDFIDPIADNTTATSVVGDVHPATLSIHPSSGSHDFTGSSHLISAPTQDLLEETGLLSDTSPNLLPSLPDVSTSNPTNPAPEPLRSVSPIDRNETPVNAPPLPLTLATEDQTTVDIDTDLDDASSPTAPYVPGSPIFSPTTTAPAPDPADPITFNATNKRPPSVQGRTQRWGGDDVSSDLVQDTQAGNSTHVTLESDPNTAMLDLEVPIELEIRLQKSKQQKRKFVPNTNKSRIRKKPKN